MNKNISIVIPAFNESRNLPILIREIKEELEKLKIKNWEVLVVDDGSRDNTSEVINKIHQKEAKVKLISLRRNEGKALALQAGFDQVTYDVVITMDGDGQDDPKEIGRFLKKLNEGYDLVSGWKKNRKDSVVKNNTSKIYNYFTNLLMKEKLNDANCGFKAYRQEVVKSLNLYGELHRYIPALAEAGGYTIAEIEINHRKRRYGKSKYGLDRFIKGALDLITVAFITRYKFRPLHMFGYLGLVFFTLGGVIGLYLSYLRLVLGEKIGDRPLLLFGALLIIVGVQITMTGLIGELITASLSKGSKRYQIKKKLL